MSGTWTIRVSGGRITLPPALRRRWGLQDGGDVGLVDLGDATLIVPGGIAAARFEVRDVLHRRYDDGLASLDDPDLADQ